MRRLDISGLQTIRAPCAIALLSYRDQFLVAVQFPITSRPHPSDTVGSRNCQAICAEVDVGWGRTRRGGGCCCCCWKCDVMVVHWSEWRCRRDHAIRISRNQRINRLRAIAAAAAATGSHRKPQHSTAHCVDMQIRRHWLLGVRRHVSKNPRRNWLIAATDRRATHSPTCTKFL